MIFVLATGEQHSVREFVELSFKELNINIDWEGSKENEIGVNAKTGKPIVKVNPKYYRPTEVETLLGDSSKAEKILGWAQKTPFSELVKKMVLSDWEKVKNRGY